MTIDIPSPQAELPAIEQALQNAIAQLQADRPQEAEKYYRAILQTDPTYPEANYGMGMLSMHMKQPDAALTYFMAALDADPTRRLYWLSYIDALSQDGQLEAAQQILALARQQGLDGEEVEALAQRLDGGAQPAEHSNADDKAANPSAQEIDAMVSRFNQGRIAEAASLAQTMTSKFPRHWVGWKMLGVALNHLGRNAEALAPMQKAVALVPNDAEAHNNLGLVLRDMGRLNEAEASFRRALEVKPNYADARNNLGGTFKMLGRLKEAEESYKKALQNNPDIAGAHINQGGIFHQSGRLDEAEASYRRALQIEPDNAEAFSNLLFCITQNASMDATRLFSEHCRFGEKFEAAMDSTRLPHPNSKVPDRILQVGFVSGDFFNHAIASYIEPLLKHLSGCKAMSLHAYYNNTIDDSTSQRLRGYFAHWHPIAGIPDAALADQIRGDGIDILIDLSGHSAKNRLLTFARKPAPVQVSWMGYPGTTGLKAMDYYLTDRHCLPPAQFDSQFTEKIVRLPASVPFLPSRDELPVNALPVMTNGYVTFGSFNRISKLSHAVIKLWANLMKSLPNSRMVVGGMPEEGEYDTVIGWFAQEGIARERLVFYRRGNMQSYLRLYQQVDICLDTFPYNGGTTTFHGLWMGVPTLTLAGPTAAGRSGASILGNVGLDAFVADDAVDFVQKGMSWTANLAALSDVRMGLREQFSKSAMAQPELIASSLEHALRTMWQRWCAGKPVESFEVTGQDVLTHDGR